MNGITEYMVFGVQDISPILMFWGSSTLYSESVLYSLPALLIFKNCEEIYIIKFPI